MNNNKRIEYEDFELRLLFYPNEGTYAAEVLRSPAGSTPLERINFPYSKTELRSFRRTVERLVRGATDKQLHKTEQAAQ